jgi:C4-dicarboxylate-specific signal transduction histidine kinase
VLHNVGNVLNSVNISASVVTESVKKSKVGNLARVVDLLDEHSSDLEGFITRNEQGRKLPLFLRQLHGRLIQEQQTVLTEAELLRQNIEHIKEIVTVQQDYAKVSGITELLKVTDLVDDSLRINAVALARDGVAVERDFQEVPAIPVEKHKVLQILVNLIGNARRACVDAGHSEKRLAVSVVHEQDRIRIAIRDNGVGIPPDNLTRIFNHGFTTRKDGHGFGLHSGALAAREMGGVLRAESEGSGKGATFTLELPTGGPTS